MDDPARAPDHWQVGLLVATPPRTEEQIERVAREFDTPLLFNHASGDRSPLPPFSRLRALGYAIILLPVDTLLSAAKAIDAYLCDLRASDDARALADRTMAFADFNELIGVAEQLRLAERYAAGG
jgi:2,3-dimethylmalate lyase